jgi:SAM-dependent methyltransferase
VAQVYDRIGSGYTTTRRPDPRLAAAIDTALGDALDLVNVGAGAGGYEPASRRVIAVEPSATMVAQRPPGCPPAVRATAEALPFRDRAFDAALAVLTLHHWTDITAGLDELVRVVRRRIVVMTWVPGAGEPFWLTTHYFPEILATDIPRFPSIERLAGDLGSIDTAPLGIPHDCTDGFLGAFWRRPEAYLDPAVRQGISAFALLEPGSLAHGLEALARDLDTGEWERRFGALRERDSLDLGYRLIVGRVGNRPVPSR